MRRLLALLLLALSCGGVALSIPSHAATDTLEVGVGRADITPPTGYYFQGWVESSAIGNGVQTRIEARAVVLKRGGQKIALVAEDLNGIAGGAVEAAALELKSRGFNDTNIIVSASHTHAAPGDYFPYTTYDTVFPTPKNLTTLTSQNISGKIDQQLYAFEVRQLVLAITRADNDLAPGKVGWGQTELLGITANRSLEAHLADFGIIEQSGTGKVSQDPGGYVDTIDPDVMVLRVDKVENHQDVPIGMWSTFANHGTVNKADYDLYNADHQGAATRVVEQDIRDAGNVPASQDIVNAFGNSDEGDQSAGLTRSGPAAAEYVGRAEANAMMSAWTAAGKEMTNTPTLATRWTRVCFCGQETQDGPVASTPTEGLPLFTGSEEGRGPLSDLLFGSNFEGDHLPPGVPSPYPAQGDKISVLPGIPGDSPTSVPLTVAQIDNRLITTIPGEMTVEMGRRLKTAVMAVAKSHGIKAVQIAGLVNEYLSYFTTPEEYATQNYEGGSTMYGPNSSLVLEANLVALTKSLLDGAKVPTPSTTDPRNGISDVAAPFSTGATQGQMVNSPTTTQRLERATVQWQGGPKGYDMPLGRAFITAQRLEGSTWVAAADDLGLDFQWTVDKSGLYSAEWEIPRDQPVGLYRFHVTANHYTLDSAPFQVTVSTMLSVDYTTVRYPEAVVNVDISYRPPTADGYTITGVRDGVVPAGGAKDKYGNCNGAPAKEDGSNTGEDPDANPAVCSAS